jgi:hypothetical protein
MKEPKDLNEEAGAWRERYVGVYKCQNCGEMEECYEVHGGVWCEKCISGDV